MLASFGRNNFSWPIIYMSNWLSAQQLCPFPTPVNFCSASKISLSQATTASECWILPVAIGFVFLSFGAKICISHAEDTILDIHKLKL
jgi:hypothetical protein